VIGPQKIEALLDSRGIEPSEAERVIADITRTSCSFEAKMNWMRGGPISNPVPRSLSGESALHKKKKFNEIFSDIALNMVERCSSEGFPLKRFRTPAKLTNAHWIVRGKMRRKFRFFCQYL